MKFYEVREIFVKSINMKMPAPMFKCNALKENQRLTLDKHNFYQVRTFNEQGEVIAIERYVPSSADNFRIFELDK